MKKLYTLFIFCLVITVGRAQIPNNDFELWSNGPNAVPDGWTSGGDTTTHRSTDHVSGNYSVRMNTWVSGTDTFRGEIVTGISDTSNGPVPAFSVSQRHSSFKGYYKYTAQNGDSAQLGALLFKHGYTSGFPYAPVGMMGYAIQAFSGPVSVFTPFSINFGYFDNTTTPDSGWVILAGHVFSRGIDHNIPIQGNSVLYVDAISFDNYISGIQAPDDITDNFKVMPNVGSGRFHLQYSLKESGYFTLKVYDMNGREMQKLASGNFPAGTYSENYDVSALSAGSYLLMLGGENGFHSEIIMIQK